MNNLWYFSRKQVHWNILGGSFLCHNFIVISVDFILFSVLWLQKRTPEIGPKRYSGFTMSQKYFKHDMCCRVSISHDQNITRYGMLHRNDRDVIDSSDFEPIKTPVSRPHGRATACLCTFSENIYSVLADRTLPYPNVFFPNYCHFNTHHHQRNRHVVLHVCDAMLRHINARMK